MLSRWLEGAHRELAFTGRLGTRLERLRLADGCGAYLKRAPAGGLDDLDAERARLVWLHGRLPVPQVLGFEIADGEQRLLLSTLPGLPAHQSPRAPSEIVERLAYGLRRVHAVEVPKCPFRARLADELASARRLVKGGWVDSPAFEAAAGLSPSALLIRLEAEASRRASEDPRDSDDDACWTHGDYCLPNVMLDGERVALLDWGLAGVGDRHRDFMAAAESITYNLGPEWVPPFFALYGIEPDPTRLELYTQVDRFFTHLKSPGEFDAATAPKLC